MDRVSGRVIGQVMVWSIGVVDRVSGRVIGQVMVGYGVSERQPGRPHQDREGGRVTTRVHRLGWGDTSPVAGGTYQPGREWQAGTRWTVTTQRPTSSLVGAAW